GYVVLARVSTGRSPFLRRLRGRLPGLVRRFRRYYGTVRLPLAVHHWVTALAFPMRPVVSSDDRCPRDLPVLAQEGSTLAWGLRPRRTVRSLALTASHVSPAVSKIT